MVVYRCKDLRDAGRTVLGNKTKRIKTAKFAGVEEELYAWFLDMRSRGANIGDDMLLEKACVLMKEHSPDQEDASVS